MFCSALIRVSQYWLSLYHDMTFRKYCNITRRSATDKGDLTSLIIIFICCKKITNNLSDRLDGYMIMLGWSHIPCSHNPRPPPEVTELLLLLGCMDPILILGFKKFGMFVAKKKENWVNVTSVPGTVNNFINRAILIILWQENHSYQNHRSW